MASCLHFPQVLCSAMGIGGPRRKTVCLACWQRARKLGPSIVLNQGVEEMRACLSAWHRSHLFTARALHLRVYVMLHQQEGVYVLDWGGSDCWWLAAQLLFSQHLAQRPRESSVRLERQAVKVPPSQGETGEALGTMASARSPSTERQRQ